MQQGDFAAQIPVLTHTEFSGKALQILQAARQVFLTHGFTAATTDMIQQEAGVSKSTVYAHFPNKEALFTAVIKVECTKFNDTMRDIQFESGRLKEILTTIAHTYLDVVLSPSVLALFRVVIAEGVRFPDLAQAFYETGPQVLINMMSRLLENMADAGEIDLEGVSYEAAANLFTGLVRSEPQLYCLTHPNTVPSKSRIDQWINLAVNTFIKAYASKPSSHPISK